MLLAESRIDEQRDGSYGADDNFSRLLVQVITEELYRNMLLAFACIFATTLFLLWNFVCCVMVLLSVVLTVVNVAGFMHFWGEQNEEQRAYPARVCLLVSCRSFHLSPGISSPNI